MFYADDVIHLLLQAATRGDALGHVHYDGHLDNGCKVQETLTVPDGAKRLGVEHLASPGMVSLAILLDVARMKNVDMLPFDYMITPDDLREACHRQARRTDLSALGQRPRVHRQCSAELARKGRQPADQDLPGFAVGERLQ